VDSFLIKFFGDGGQLTYSPASTKRAEFEKQSAKTRADVAENMVMELERVELVEKERRVGKRQRSFVSSYLRSRLMKKEKAW
jgi:hypothetical protein